MKIKTWILSGVTYVSLVMITFAVITGGNPFESTDMLHDEHGEHEHMDE
ncbi:hypothetical protein [Alkalihalobacillus pseudalcaliphilus]|nr:hypothetical protein [Alkalihalobacillus pseudalcaliphilus]